LRPTVAEFPHRRQVEFTQVSNALSIGKFLHLAEEQIVFADRGRYEAPPIEIGYKIGVSGLELHWLLLRRISRNVCFPLSHQLNGFLPRARSQGLPDLFAVQHSIYPDRAFAAAISPAQRSVRAGLDVTAKRCEHRNILRRSFLKVSEDIDG
jgi:hypothetical protein